jgi:hypothetical protein
MLAMNDIRNWRIVDPDPGRSLQEITPVSRRAAALIARNAGHSLMRTDFMRIVGTVPMLEGLDYHHRQSLGYLERLALGGLSEEAHAQLLFALDHEAVAYVNRAGQLLGFALSKEVDTPVASIPKLMELKLFRDKFSAHRSIDRPRGENANLQVLHAISLTTLGGYLLAPKDGATLPDDPWHPSRYRSHYLCYQVRRDADTVFFFSIERDHPTVAVEVYGALELFILKEH